MTLKSGFGVVQGHQKWHHSKAWIWFGSQLCSEEFLGHALISATAEDGKIKFGIQLGFG